MRTRSAAPSTKPEPEEPSNATTPSSNTLKPAERPSKTFILPSYASDDARFVTLPNPRTGELSRYFFCPKLGVYEFTVVAAAPQAPRSILVTSKTDITTDSKGDHVPTKGAISKTAELLIATPIDIIFFVIPLLSPSPSNQSKGLFQPLDDIIDSHDEIPKHLRYVLYNETFRDSLNARVEAICDTVEAGDEKMFRLSETKLLKELIAKAERMVAQGLPVSLEERFVRQALVTPLMAVKREDASTNGATSNGDKADGESPEKQETQSGTSSDTTPANETSENTTPATEPPSEEVPSTDNVTHLLRISTALSFVKESYLSRPICTKFDEMLAAPESPLDFKPLQDRLKEIAGLRAQALASRTLSDFSRKRGPDDDEGAESRAEKKRRMEEEEKKKKANESRGVKDLKKVNTTGMKKMSDFFAKSAPKKKS
ncbi:hypothetical protein MW887_001546 [Aspergillus wentii]|nr:hypothetical protein MW887_001546 [Aspergillus wentii]